MLNLFRYKIIFYCFFIVSCSNFEPIYNYEIDSNIREGITDMYVLPVEGRYGTVLRNELIEAYGSNTTNKNTHKYTLQSTVSSGTSGAQAYESDGTASRLVSNVSVTYAVYDSNKCLIFSGSNSTKASFNSKSGGFDYGNIASEKQAITSNIEYNVKDFYPFVYNAIKNKKSNLPFIPPFLTIKNFKGCRG